MDALRVLLSLAVIGWLMWWIVGTPSRSQGRARALILTVVDALAMIGEEGRDSLR